jgi:hypothetical protein
VTEHPLTRPGHADIRLASTVDVVMAALKGILADGLVSRALTPSTTRS